METIIKVSCVDQELELIDDPVVSSGGVHENYIEFQFCSKWDGFVKVAVFHRKETPNDKIRCVISENRCEIPYEITEKEGLFYFGVFGTLGETVRTSDLVRYRVVEGPQSGEDKVQEPTPDVYQQMLSLFNDTTKEVNDTKAIVEEKLRTVGMRYDLLWENPNPSDEFAGQIITFGEDTMSKYHFFCITYKEYKTSMYDQFYVMLKNRHAYDTDYVTGVPGAYYNEQMLGFSLISENFVSPIKRPVFTTLDKTGINIQDGRYMAPDGVVVRWNQHLIPCKIYGVVQNSLTASDDVVKEAARTYMEENPPWSEVIQNIENLSIFVTPQMYGAKADGITDDTTAIQEALDASSYVYFPDGTYVVNGTNDGWGHTREGGIYPRSNQTIVLSNNAILKAKDNVTGFYNIVNINSVENVHISGGKIQGDKTTPTRVDPEPGGEFGYGVYVTGSNNITIENMEIFDCWGDSVIIGYSGSNGVNSNNVKVINCVLHDSRRQGVSIVGCINAMIRDCEIYNISGTAPQYGIDIEPDGTVGVARNITIDGCYIHDCAVGGIVVAKVENEITGINITNCTVQSVNVVGGSEVSVSGCNIMRGINFRSSSPVRVSNSTVRYVYLSGGFGIFDNCDIIDGTNTYLIVSSTDGYPDGISNLTCYNCRLSTGDNTQYFLITHGGDATNGHPADIISFVNCSIDMGENCVFANLFNLNEMRIDSCKIVYKKDLYEMFTFGSRTTSLILRNIEFECSGTPSYMFNTAAGNVNIEMSNCKVPIIKNFLYSDAGATGNIRLFNNEINKTSFVGSGVFDKFISNSIDTVPTVGSNNLITSGAVQEALENYKPNVNTSGIEYEAVDSVEQMTDTNKVYMLKSSGTFWVYGESSLIPNFENLANLASGDWVADSRLNSSGVAVSCTDGNVITTNYIDCKVGDVIRIKGVTLGNYNAAVYYGSSKTVYSTAKPTFPSSNTVWDTEEESPGVYKFTIKYTNASAFRFSGVLVGVSNEVMITKNEEMSYRVGYGWYDTGMTSESLISGGHYVALLANVNSYGIRISALEQKVASL